LADKHYLIGTTATVMDVASDSAYLTMAKTGLHAAEMKLNETHSGNSMPVAATTAYRAGRSV
jgi:hypothetical protein